MLAASLPPGPPGTLLGGNLPAFRRDRLDFMRQCTRDYGDVVALRLGPRRLFLVNHPDGIEEVLVTQARNFIKHFALRGDPFVLGNGLLTSEGDFWLRQRRLIQPAFLPSRIAVYAPAMVAAAERLMSTWQVGETRDLLVEMKRLTLAIAAETLFGADATNNAATVNRALQVLQEHFITRFNSLVKTPIWLPTRANLRFRRAVRELDAIVYDFIHKRRASGSDRPDLLSLLLRARDEDGGGQMTDRQVRDEAMTLFLAGHETTALALSWTWYSLTQNPAAEERLLAEVREVLGGRAPTAEDWPRLKFTEHVVQEAMRLYPPVYAFGREASTTCTITGFRVPAGTTILMSPWVVHRDPRFYEAPEQYRPERWSSDAVRTMPKFAYCPFGGGPRICIGNSFAMMEMVLLVATLVQRFRFTLLPEPAVVPSPTFTLRPRNGIPVQLERR
jgi:cytochrome P450